MAAAEAVCIGEGLARDDVLGTLSLLVEKSLVIADPTNGSTRYRLLEVVRQYAGKQLAAAEEGSQIAARHAAYFLDLAESAERRSIGPDEGIWFDRLALEHDNLRAALSWLTGPAEDGPEGARLAAALWPFWFARGFPVEGIEWLQAAMRRCRAEDRAPRAKALNGLVVLAVFQEDYDLAWDSGQECLALYRELGDPDGTASALTALSTAAVAGQRAGVSVADLVAEARALRPRLRDQRAMAYLLDIEGVLALQGGDPVLALARWQEAVTLHRELGNQLGAAFILANLGLLTARMGERESAGSWLVECLRLSHHLDYKLIIMYGLIGMGELAAATGRIQRAARLWGAADGMTDAYGAHLTRGSRAIVDYDQQLARARQQLDPVTWSGAWA